MANSPSALTTYIDKRNALAKIFGDKQINLQTLTYDEAQSLANSLASDLSPENLCCDGEASVAYVVKRKAFLNKVVNELQKMYAVEVLY